MKRILGMVLVLLLTASVASAAVKMKLGPGFNSFSDSRVVGMSQSFEVAFDLDKFSAGYRVEQMNLTVTDTTVAAGGGNVNFRIVGQITSLILEKEVKKVSNMPISVGIELGSLVSTALPGTAVATPAAAGQTVPVIGIKGGIAYETEGKLPTAFNLGIGYRFIDLNDVALGGGFIGTAKTLDDLNAFRIEATVGISF